MVIELAGFIRSAKVGGKGYFSLRSGKVRETCNGQGKIALLSYRSGKKYNFLAPQKYLMDLFSI